MRALPSGYDEGVDMSEMEPVTLVECICQRPGLFIAGDDLRGILAWLEGYEVATRFAFDDESIPDHYDTSPMDVMDALVVAMGSERCGKPIHFEFEKVIAHFGSEAAVLTAMTEFAKKCRDSGTPE